MRLLQPSSSVQVSKQNPDRFVKRAAKIIRTGFGQPSIFNADLILHEVDSWPLALLIFTTACIGKWHLGHHPPFYPTRHGFDHYYGLPYSNDMGRQVDPPPMMPERPPLPLMVDGEVVEQHLGVAGGPQPHRGRHGAAEVGEAGHQGVRLRRGAIQQGLLPSAWSASAPSAVWPPSR